MKTSTKMQREKIQELINKGIDFVKTHGAGFAVYALAMNALDELIIPAIFAYFGHPVLGGAAMLGDLDFITYPLYFVVKNVLIRSKSLLNQLVLG